MAVPMSNTWVMLLTFLLLCLESIGMIHHERYLLNKCRTVLLSEDQDIPLIEKIEVGAPKSGVHKFRIVDTNLSDKRTSFIALQQDNFEFIGSDRQDVCIDSIDNISRIIGNTNEPNYKVARFPLKSGLSMRSWEDRLADYLDKSH